MQEDRKKKSERNMTVSTECHGLDEGDADGTKLYNEYERGELYMGKTPTKKEN